MFYTTKILPLLDSLRIGALAYNLFAPRGQFHQVKREEGGKMSTFEEEKDSLEVDKALSRRAFLKGGATVGAVAALGGVTLAGCTPSSQQSESTTTTPTGTTDVAAGPDADPIPPVEAPASWDAEADVVVVGTGGGGLAASLYLSQQGNSIIAIEKEGQVGGATRHAAAFANPCGGTKEQNEMGFGIPSFPPDPIVYFRIFNSEHNYSVDQDLMLNMIRTAPEAVDWFLVQDGIDFVCQGAKWLDREVAEGRHYNGFGMSRACDAFEKSIASEGGEILLNTKCETLVFDGERVLGVKVTDANGADMFIKGNKGVILCAGGIGMNKDLIAKYLPSAVKGAVQGGPMPYHTGEAFRMGLGVGADYSGFNSWCVWEGAIDESIAGGDGQFWHYFYRGERQLFHNPWLVIDKRGKRQPYYAKDITQGFDATKAGNNLGDVITTSAWMSAIGGHVYSICDSNFPENIYKNYTTAPGNTDVCRLPVDDQNKIDPKAAALYSADWLGEVDEAVARGAVKKADTIEELADMLLLDRDIVVKAVENWNSICAKGVDDELAYPYDESWLHPVADPPFYAAIVGGQLGKTMCGLRVGENLQVLDPDGKTIPGLFANFSTAGGFSGEGDYAGFWNPTIWGGNAASWISGYIAAKELLKKEG